MNCAKCGKSFQDGFAFCPYCGKKQVNLPSKKPKRANGLGSVYYDSRRNMWIAQVVVEKTYTKDMKVRFSYKRTSYKTRTDALKAVQSVDATKIEHPDFTLSYYFTTYENGKMASLSADKQKAHKIAYNRLKTLWNVPVKDLTISDLQTVISASCGSYYPAKDVRAVLNAIFVLAAADDRSINPALPSFVKLPKLNETQIEPFTEEEQLKLWYSYESGNQNAAVPLLMIYTGMMPGEMRKLDVSMIDLDKQEIAGAGLKTNERIKKVILLPNDIIPVLFDLMDGKDNLLFPMSEQKFYGMYYQSLKDAGIERHLTPYSCRHTTATVLAIHENVAPQTLQRVMRWKSTRMMDRYVTPTDQDARNAVNKI